MLESHREWEIKQTSEVYGERELGKRGNSEGITGGDQISGD